MSRSALLLVAVVIAGCGSDDSSDETGGTTPAAGSSGTVELVATDFEFDPSTVAVAAAGTTTFRLTNDGGTTHALEIDGQGIEEETDEIGPGESAVVTVDLEPGEYELYCPVGNHRSLGMEGTLVVGGGAAGSTATTDETETDDSGGTTTNDDDPAYGGSPRAVTPRARDLGIEIGRLPSGPANAITDVPGIRVGHTTLIEGDNVRTGVTVVLPPAEPCFAGAHRINGNGELTGLEWIRDSGLLTTPIGLTNTHSVGVVRDAIVAEAKPGEWDWSLPVVGETWDGFLNDVNGFHVKPEHVAEAFASASDGRVEEGSVGGGTGMVCHGFKGGIGTASRVVEDGWMVGVLVQANHGRRPRLRVNGIPVGERIGPEAVPLPERGADAGAGSIIALIATDAPLLSLQSERVARRAAFGIARTGGMGERSSGDFALCFATGNRGLESDAPELPLRMLNDGRIDPIYEAVIDAVEEAIVNALLAAETMTGREGNTVYALPHDSLLDALRLS